MSDQFHSHRGAKEMGYKAVRPLLIKFWTTHPRTAQSVEDIAEATGLRVDQVKSGINNLRNSGIFPGIKTLSAGQMWSYEPENAAETSTESSATQTRASSPRRRRGTLRTFEEVGETRDGALIVKDNRGALYRAEEL